MCLIVGDLEGLDEWGVKSHLIDYWLTGEDVQTEKFKALQIMGLEVIVAFESVEIGETSAVGYYLLQDYEGKLFECYGSHCSCMGFEGQFILDETTAETLYSLLSQGLNIFTIEDTQHSDIVVDIQKRINEYVLKFVEDKINDR